MKLPKNPSSKPCKEDLQEWADWANSYIVLHQLRSGLVPKLTPGIRRSQRWVASEIASAKPKRTVSAPASAARTLKVPHTPKH